VRVRTGKNTSGRRTSPAQQLFVVQTREALLLALCKRTFTDHTLVFCGTKAQAHRLHILFGLFGLKAAELHGNLTQLQVRVILRGR